MKQKRKIEILRRIRDMLDQQVRPTLREAGLSETEFQELDKESLFDKGFGAVEEGLDRYVILALNARAVSVLSLADEPVLRVRLVPPAASRTSSFFSALRKKLWELILAALAILGIVLAAWYSWKRGWK